MNRVPNIISGGQTGADRAALNFAIRHGIPHGGWCPKGRLAEDGPIDVRYPLKETPSPNYVQRTEWNARDSDGTVVFSIGEVLTGGSKKTVELAEKHGKPVLHLSRSGGPASPEQALLGFILEHNIKVLNVAGSRASKEPEVGAFVQEVLDKTWPSTGNHSNRLPSIRLTISEHLNGVLRDWRNSLHHFPKNTIQRPHWPIPFFGNPAKALVATVGVNPSSAEFELTRGWADVKTAADWKRRLRDYFKIDVPPHEWFEPWRNGLQTLGMSYEQGTAAHIDVSYRPTMAMLRDKTTDRKEFGQMVERDVAWLFRLLPLCENLRLLLVFGPIVRSDGSTGNLAQFLKDQAQNHGFNVLQHGDLQHAETGRMFFFHEADTHLKESVTIRVERNLTVHGNELRLLLKPTSRHDLHSTGKEGG